MSKIWALFFPFSYSLTHWSYHTDILMSVKQHCCLTCIQWENPDCKFLSITVCLFFTYQSVSLSQVTLDFLHVLACKCCSVSVLSDTSRNQQCYQRHKDKNNISCLCFHMWASISELQCMLSWIPDIRWTTVGMSAVLLPEQTKHNN